MDRNHQLTVSFKAIYVSYYARMKRFAEAYIMSEADAENIVQDVFLDLWERQDVLEGRMNKTGWLLTSVKNRCVDFLRHKMVEQRSAEQLQEEYMRTLQMKFESLEAFDEEYVAEHDIESVVSKAIQTLPEKCRMIFIKSKIEGKKQKDIAEELGLSLNTIETQMGIAYKKTEDRTQNTTPHAVLFIYVKRTAS